MTGALAAGRTVRALLAAGPAVTGAVVPGQVSARTLVIGFGNSLRSDDGIGWSAAERLADDPRRGATQVIRRQQLTPELSLDISAASLVVFIDASSVVAAGEVTVRMLTAVPGSAAWTHHMTPEALLAMTRDLYAATPDATLVSIGADSFAVGDGLSPAVERALPVALDIVLALIKEHVQAESREHADA